MSSPMSDISPSTIEESFPGSKDLARLGEELIGQLDRFEDDICSAWMAHHLARLMQDAKGATGEAKPEAEDRCRTAILSLWRQLGRASVRERVGQYVEISVVAGTLHKKQGETTYS